MQCLCAARPPSEALHARELLVHSSLWSCQLILWSLPPALADSYPSSIPESGALSCDLKVTEGSVMRAEQSDLQRLWRAHQQPPPAGPQRPSDPRRHEWWSQLQLGLCLATIPGGDQSQQGRECREQIQLGLCDATNFERDQSQHGHGCRLVMCAESNSG